MDNISHITVNLDNLLLSSISSLAYDASTLHDNVENIVVVHVTSDRRILVAILQRRILYKP